MTTDHGVWGSPDDDERLAREHPDDVITGWPDHHIVNGDPTSCGCPQHWHLSEEFMKQLEEQPMPFNFKNPLVSVDTETTGLDPDRHEVWELAFIQHRSNGTYDEIVYQIRPDLTAADPEALEINRFHERFRVPDGAAAAIIDAGNTHPIALDNLREIVTYVLWRSVLIGSNTAFDAAFLRKLLGGNAPWHYRTVNALELAAGALMARGVEVPIPWNSADLSRLIGVEPPDKKSAHTALADARWARDVFNAVREADAVSPVYRERAHLLATLAHAAGPQNAAMTPALDADEGWWLLGLRVAGKVCTWHISPRDLPLFNGVERVRPEDPRVHWDGHTTAEKYLWLQTIAGGS